MERIKDALDQARRSREKAVLERTVNNLVGSSTADVNDLIDARRIRERVPFNQLQHEEQQALIAAGEVLRLDGGQHVFAVGDQDDRIHYLLEGAVSILGEGAPAHTLYAYQEAALLPLDDAGTKSHTVTVLIPSRIFRIPHARLSGRTATPAAPEDSREDDVPRELYAHTYSGEQLAQLVDALHADRKGLAAETAGGTPPRDEVKFGENTLGVRLDSIVSELTPSVPPAVEAAPPPTLPSHDEINDEISRFTRELEGRFRRYVDVVRSEERRRAQAQLQVHVKRLQKLAEQQLRGKVETIRDRYHEAYLAKERKLRERYGHLITLTNTVTRQKAAIYQARRQLEDKLRLAEQVHNELAQIGLNVTRQLNDLEGMIPDENTAAPE
ncbi:MAG: hypothetical protein HYX63_08940 [Gammaproteobacteria bacterium]|nr:hypothetical protein [Gammaproteobacteria bacterium]